MTQERDLHHFYVNLLAYVDAAETISAESRSLLADKLDELGVRDDTLVQFGTWINLLMRSETAFVTARDTMRAAFPEQARGISDRRDPVGPGAGELADPEPLLPMTLGEVKAVVENPQSESAQATVKQIKAKFLPWQFGQDPYNLILNPMLSNPT